MPFLNPPGQLLLFFEDVISIAAPQSINDNWKLGSSLADTVAYTFQPVSTDDSGSLTLTETVTQSVS